jgi:hypothetical protein
MNTEKLDALAAQAGFDVARLRAPYPGGFPREDMLALESFAELIVEECIAQAHSIGDARGTNDYIMYGAELAAAISKHFGVEE